MDPSEYLSNGINHVQRLPENEKQVNEIDFSRKEKLRKAHMKSFKLITEREKVFQRISTPILKDKKKKEYYQKIPTNKTKICFLESNPNGIRTNEILENEETCFLSQRKKFESIDEINKELIINSFEAIGRLPQNFRNNSINSIRKLDFLGHISNKSILLPKQFEDTILEKETSQFDKGRLCESFCENFDDSNINKLDYGYTNFIILRPEK